MYLITFFSSRFFKFLLIIEPYSPVHSHFFRASALRLFHNKAQFSILYMEYRNQYRIKFSFYGSFRFAPPQDSL